MFRFKKAIPTCNADFESNAKPRSRLCNSSQPLSTVSEASFVEFGQFLWGTKNWLNWWFLSWTAIELPTSSPTFGKFTIFVDIYRWFSPSENSFLGKCSERKSAEAILQVSAGRKPALCGGVRHVAKQTWCTFSSRASQMKRSINGRYPKLAGWFFWLGKSIYKWMMTGGSAGTPF